MGLGRKHDYPPLLPPGRHTMTLLEVERRFVHAFPGNARRAHLFHKFEEFMQTYLLAAFPCEIWLDGSFLTEKPEPGDIDATVMIEPHVGASLTPEQSDLISRTLNDAAFAPEVDGFAYVKLERDDPDYGDEMLDPASTWHEVYGAEHSKEWLKGFVVLKLRETDVGLRVCR